MQTAGDQAGDQGGGAQTGGGGARPEVDRRPIFSGVATAESSRSAATRPQGRSFDGAPDLNFTSSENPRFGGEAGGGAAALQASLERMEGDFRQVASDLRAGQDQMRERLDALGVRVGVIETRLLQPRDASGAANVPPVAPGPAVVAAEASIASAAEEVEVDWFEENRPVKPEVAQALRIAKNQRTPEQQQIADRAFSACFVKPVGRGQYCVPMGTGLTGMGDIVDGPLSRRMKVAEVGQHASERDVYYWIAPGDSVAAAGVGGLEREGRRGSSWDKPEMESIPVLYVARAGMNLAPCARWLQVDVDRAKVMAPALGRSADELPQIKLPQTRPREQGRGGL